MIIINAYQINRLLIRYKKMNKNYIAILENQRFFKIT